MNYRHAYHAGNFADVLKHVSLVTVLLHLRKKETAFAVIDCHGGRGVYDLSGEQARKTGEAEAAIGRLFQLDSVAVAVRPYLELVRAVGPPLYPGSPLIAAKLLRSKDRLVAIEKHPEEYAELTRALGTNRRIRLIRGDYVEQLPKLVPPPERRGVVLIDPPYEAEDEFAVATRVLVAAHRRFANGIFLFWYPAKERASVDASAGELLTAGVKSLLKIELDIGRPASLEVGESRLSATGLLVVNPPFGFAETMREAVLFLQEHLAQGPDASGAVEVLAEA